MKNDKEFPLVAVVTPVYNGAPYIERTLACVQAQTYPNIVHCVLDNASNDGSTEMIEAAKGGPVPIIVQRNEELLAQIPNWNASIAMTPKDAKYVKFIAADDLMREDCIEKMVALAESDDEVDFVHAIDVFNDEPKPHGLDESQTIYPGKDYGARYLRGEVTWLSATHVFFRVTPERLVNPFPEHIRPFMDNDFIVDKLLDRKMGYIFEPLLYTRYDEGTETAALGGFRAYVMPTFELLLRHGERFLSKADFEKMKHRQQSIVLRNLFFWQMSGDLKSAGNALVALSKQGFKLTGLNYIGAIIRWPFYKMIKAQNQPTSDLPNMKESDFLPEQIPYKPSSSDE